ncbi:signal transduction histidine kinase [Stackebrandtia endophytica]|uniref:histidine kinase n=1 Tax=Stackebrandtia endophytica TaxID=1496996 RepID=A0A543AZM1_9ACTN|nr:sensor histidine kinase [Stackebrandtia endophytica]TQL78033.1 signal transduction histidine kinase [Stackebrandtia endophytica]
MTKRAWLNGAMHAGFFLLLAASTARLLARHELTDQLTLAALIITVVLAVLYGGGVVLWNRLGAGNLLWLGSVLSVYVALVLVAPAFAWCAIPLYFLCLRLMTARATVIAAVALTAAVIAGQLRITQVVEPSLVLAPLGIAAMITAVFWVLQTEIRWRQQLINELTVARDSLAAEQIHSGVLAERQRLAREIHDTVAQGLSSISMLLQAADRGWESPRARGLVAQAAAVADENLAEARRVVHDLSPARLDDTALPEALRGLCSDVTDRTGLSVEFRTDGASATVAEEVSTVLLRVAQAALGNVVEHARADHAVVTLSHLASGLVLEVTDDGGGFDSATSTPHRGFGIPGMHARVSDAGGDLVVRSVPGEGTTVTATIPSGDGRERR